MDGLAELRRSKGFSQRTLAKAAGVSPSTIYALERGINSTPHPSTAKKLAGAMGVDVSDVLRAVEDPKAPAPPSSEPTLDDVLEEERRAEELGRVWAQQVPKIRQHREELLQRRLDEATTQDAENRADLENRAGLEFYAAWLHAHVLIGEAVELGQATEVPELRAAMHAWREKAMDYHAPLLWPAEVGEMLKDLEAPMPTEEAGAQAPQREIRQ